MPQNNQNNTDYIQAQIRELKIKIEDFERDRISINSNTNVRQDVVNFVLDYLAGRITLGVGTSSPDKSSVLDLTATDRSFLPPRMTSAQRDAITSPATGSVIYNTTTGVLNFYNGSAWGAV